MYVHVIVTRARVDVRTYAPMLGIARLYGRACVHMLAGPVAASYGEMHVRPTVRTFL